MHCHLGSPIYEVEPFQLANEVMISFAAQMRDRHGLELREYSPGGGYAVQYTRERPAPSPDVYADAVTDSLVAYRQLLPGSGPPEVIFGAPGGPYNVQVRFPGNEVPMILGNVRGGDQITIEEPLEP